MPFTPGGPRSPCQGRQRFLVIMSPLGPQHGESSAFEADLLPGMLPELRDPSIPAPQARCTASLEEGGCQAPVLGGTWAPLEMLGPTAPLCGPGSWLSNEAVPSPDAGTGI